MSAKGRDNVTEETVCAGFDNDSHCATRKEKCQFQKVM